LWPRTKIVRPAASGPRTKIVRPAPPARHRRRMPPRRDRTIHGSIGTVRGARAAAHRRRNRYGSGAWKVGKSIVTGTVQCSVPAPPESFYRWTGNVAKRE
jgi:hypothetical protein